MEKIVSNCYNKDEHRELIAFVSKILDAGSNVSGKEYSCMAEGE